MSIWIILWIVLSLTLLLFFGWTLVVLFKQKAAWKVFAAQHKLRYKRRTMMQAPDMDGVIDDYKMNFFPSEHISADIKGTRNLTAIEITLSTTLPIEGTLASAGMVPIAKGLGFKAELRPDFDGWDETYIAVTDNKAVLAAYLTPERLDVITRLMKMKNTWVMLISLKDTLLLRVDMTDPLLTQESLDKAKKRMVTAAKILELKEGEGTRLKTEETRSESRDVSLDMSDDVVSSLQLEDDDDAPVHIEEPSEANSKAEEKPETKPKAKPKPKKKESLKPTKKPKA